LNVYETKIVKKHPSGSPKGEKMEKPLQLPSRGRMRNYKSKILILKKSECI